MTAKDYFQRLLNKFWSEDFKPQIEIISIVPETITQQKTDSSAECRDFGFRPFTEKEKREFNNSLDAKGKQILAELKGKPIGGRRRKLRVASDQSSMSDAERTMVTHFAHFGKLDVA